MKKESKLRIDILCKKYEGRDVPYGYDQCSDYKFLINRAGCLKTPAKLAAMARINCTEIEEALYLNPNITAPAVECLYAKKEKTWRMSSIARCKATPAHILNDLLKYRDAAVQRYAIKHKNTPEDMLDDIIQNSEDITTLVAVLERLQNDTRLEKIYTRYPHEHKILIALVYNSYTSTQLLTKLIKDNLTWCDLYRCVRHHNMSPKMLEFLYPRLKSDAATCRTFARHNNTPEWMLKELTTHKEDFVVVDAVNNSKFKLQVKEKQLARNATEVLFIDESKISALLDTDNTQANMLRAIYHKKKNDNWTLRKILGHPNIDVELTEQILESHRGLVDCMNSKFEFYFETEIKEESK